MNIFLRGILLLAGLLILWQSIVTAFQLPPYILPSPLQVLFAFQTHYALIAKEAVPTIIETLLGLLLGILFGSLTALCMAYFRPVHFWLLPILIISQAIPTFAIAPLLVIWFGYGIASKIVTTVLMIFFPITSAFYDGLKQTEPGWLDLAKTMNAKKWRTFWFIRIPNALPRFASGLRVAAVIAPIGAIIGEWVGAAQGLGFLMLSANARMQIDLMFAVLFTIIILSLLLYFITNELLRITITW
jgi:putative hydroxymethylpyrimidine transport system permease protein